MLFNIYWNTSFLRSRFSDNDSSFRFFSSLRTIFSILLVIITVLVAMISLLVWEDRAALSVSNQSCAISARGQSWALEEHLAADTLSYNHVERSGISAVW